jgi:3-dehydroquinate synthase
LAEAMGRIPSEITSRQHALLQAAGLPVTVPDANVDRLIELMRHDKKVEYGQLRFILPDRIGHVEIVDDVTEDLVRDAWMG